METLQHCEDDALLVEELLDFSCGDIGDGDDCAGTCVREKENSYLQDSAAVCSIEASQGSLEFGDCLYAPAGEGAEWDWWSSFVEESYKGADNSILVASSDEWFGTGGRREGCFITGGWEERRPTSWLRMGTSSQILDVGSSPLIEPPNNTSSCWPRSERSRSKRSSRSGGRVWSLQRVMQMQPTTGRKHPCDGDDDDDQEASSLDYEPYPDLSPKFNHKKPKKDNNDRNSNAMHEGRRCSHCQVQKTPQWRAGPLGPKTLCNACGVRYKSGRLLPEYRPAASPTFISALHSNSHKKVLEMRTFKSCVAQELDQDEFSSCSQESVSSLHP